MNGKALRKTVFIMEKVQWAERRFSRCLKASRVTINSLVAHTNSRSLRDDSAKATRNIGS
ncbi:hypothetical protein E2C01_037142 [Portunus trituberculatus]|uniref:Uncharacterized protein n=1 Tax=Portunus trituberculatus TaxID=210409 RepID=A0A5B7FEH9_PORTR|nr:hypothetical protein [Portunus trituberculatus]